MKYPKIIFATIIIISLVSFFILSDKEYIMGERVIDYDRGDIDGNGEEELIVVTKSNLSKYGKEVVIYSSEDVEIYRKDFADLKPWKLVIGDIDGDGVDEVSIGVYKETIFHPVMDNRPFIYSYKQGRLYPKWRGSRLSRPFTDYLFYDIDGDDIDEIIAIEILENEEKLINTYKWRGFGFEAFLESESFKDIDDLRLYNGSVYMKIKDENGNYTGIIELEDDNIIIERGDLNEEK